MEPRTTTEEERAADAARVIRALAEIAEDALVAYIGAMAREHKWLTFSAASASDRRALAELVERAVLMNAVRTANGGAR